MAANKLKDVFNIYDTTTSIATSGYNWTSVLDAKSTCNLFIESNASTPQRALSVTGPVMDVVTVEFSAGEVYITEDAQSATGTHLIDVSAVAVSLNAGTVIRFTFWDGYNFREFQFVA